MTLPNDVVPLLLLFLLPRAAAQSTDPATSTGSDFNIGPALNPSMSIIMIVIISAFFSLGLFSVYIRRCTGSRFRGDGASDNELFFGQNRLSWRAARGVGDDVIRTFPIFQYSAVKRLKIGKGALECAVCLCEFEDDETLRLIPKCNHVFHADCVDAWLASHVTCPVCRAHLLPKPGENSASAPVHATNPDETEQNLEPEVNLLSPSTWSNQNRTRPRSTAQRFGGLFPRSHSTGHSLVQQDENCERFTLRLPKDVRSRIMNSSINLNRTRSLGVLPRARSERKGYRFDRENRPDRWGFSMVPPFISRTGTVQLMGSSGNAEDAMPQRSLLQSFRDPVDQLFLGPENVGQRSSDRLRFSNEV